jgi:hypothetical protein
MTGGTTGATDAMTDGTTGATGAMTDGIGAVSDLDCSDSRELDDQACQ